MVIKAGLNIRFHLSKIFPLILLFSPYLYTLTPSSSVCLNRKLLKGNHPIRPFLPQHWTNVVCWLAHVVVAIPAVFIPLAVFLSPQGHSLKAADLPTAQDLEVHKEKEESQKDKAVPKQEDLARDCAEGKGSPTEAKGEESPQDSAGEEAPEQPAAQGTRKAGESPRDNLKFYLGTDILKYGIRSSQKHDDRKMILTNEWGLPSISEV